MSSSSVPQDVVQAVAAVVGSGDHSTGEIVLLHRPYFPRNAAKYTAECVETGWVSSAGAFVTRFEEELARFTGCRRAVATVNGTAALQVCFHLAGVRRDDEVICPSLTFVATANAISHSGAVPHFVDVCPKRLGLDPQKLLDRLRQIVSPGADGPVNRETGRRIGAICPMHCLGHPVDLDAIVDICRQFDIPLVEDAAESLGSYYKGRHTGRDGIVSALSFNGNKIVTTGGGGAILTNDEELASRAKHLTTTAKVPHAWEFFHDEVAWNFRMPNINAALGVAQLEILPQLLDAKRQLASHYAAAFAEVEEVKFLQEPGDSSSNYWLNCVLLDADQAHRRDETLELLNRSGYQARPLWQPMHQLVMYSACPRGSLEVAESVQSRAINIPSSPDLMLKRTSTSHL